MERSAIRLRSTQFFGTFSKVILAAALWFFALLTFTLLPFAGYARERCFVGDTRLVCADAGQLFVICLPLAVAPAAALVGTWGLRSTRAEGVLAWVGAFAGLIVTWVVSIICVDGP